MARLPSGRLGAAEVWLAGSLHARNWTHATAAAVGLAIALPVAFWLLRRLSVLELGDELATGAEFTCDIRGPRCWSSPPFWRV
ncbi:hypothetical protein GCM10029992_32320 [Glycomyces albus]